VIITSLTLIYLEHPNMNKDKYKVSVGYEWETLRDVIIGIGDNIVMPTHDPKLKAIESRLACYNKKFSGKKLSECDPILAEKVVLQINDLAKTLKKRGINVHRCQPLEPEEEIYLERIQKGYELLFPRDILIVIDNHIIESAIKLPFRRKDNFSIRHIIAKYMDNCDGKFVSVPRPSPTLAENNIFLEGGDVLLGEEIYVGCSGLASNIAGYNWLRSYLGSTYKLRLIELPPNVLHLDISLSLIRPGLAIRCPNHFPNGMPTSLKYYDFIDITEKEANDLSGNIFVLDRNTVIVDNSNLRVKQELEKRKVEVITLPYDAVSQYGGGFRCSHHPLRRED
jgi:glycine amidinotransferase